MSNDNSQGNGPPAGLHFLKALGHGAMAFGHLMFGQPNEDESAEETTAPRRRRKVATGRRANSSGSCCSGRRR